PAQLDFDTSEAIASSVHLAPRRSSGRRIAFDRDALRMPDDLSGPIEASIFSLPSSYFTPQEAMRFLAAVRATSPKRRLVVLADRSMRDGLGPDIDFIDDHARPFTPWTRDPFIVARATSGG